METRKKQLEAAKAKGGNAWTKELQNELDELVVTLVDVSEVYEAKLATVNEPEAEAEAKTEGYVVPKGTEKLVHVKLVRGRRFNPLTGKETSKPYVQMFTYGEWQLFKTNFKKLGYLIIEALHDPYGDAKALVTDITKA